MDRVTQRLTIWTLEQYVAGDVRRATNEEREIAEAWLACAWASVESAARTYVDCLIARRGHGPYRHSPPEYVARLGDVGRLHTVLARCFPPGEPPRIQAFKHITPPEKKLLQDVLIGCELAATVSDPGPFIENWIEDGLDAYAIAMTHAKGAASST